MTIRLPVRRAASRFLGVVAGRLVQPYSGARTFVEFVTRTGRYRAHQPRVHVAQCQWVAVGAASTSCLVGRLADDRRPSAAPPTVTIEPAGPSGPLKITTTHVRGADESRIIVDSPLLTPVFFPQCGRGVTRSALGGERLSVGAIRNLQRRARVFVPPSGSSPEGFAQWLVDVAGAGVLLEFESQPDKRPEFVGPLTFEALCSPPASTSVERELRSVRLRRSVLREHGSAASARLVCGGSEAAGRPVSVALATRRPGDLPQALRQIERQIGCDVQLLVGLHGDEWKDIDLERVRADVGDLVVQRFDESVLLGDVLTALSTQADCDVVTKWDDDDWYGREHLLDLTLAYDYSGADIVGKAAEFVYLEDIDRTIRRSAFGAETYAWNLAGGTILTSRAWILERGGWPSVPRHVDRLFLDSSRSAGGSAYRTHGFQYVLRRRGDGTGHTWSAPDSYFSETAAFAHEGLDLDVADVAPC